MQRKIRKTLGEICKPLILNTYADVLIEKKEESEVLSRVRLFATPWTVDFPGKNTGVGCHFLLPDPGIKPGSLDCRQILLSEPPEKPQMY